MTCPKCQTELPPTAVKCSVCGQDFANIALATQEEILPDDLNVIPDIAPPSLSAVPPYLNNYRSYVTLAGVVLFILLSVTLLRYDEETWFNAWNEECLQKIGDKNQWAVPTGLPLKEKFVLIFVPRGDRFLREKADSLLARLPIDSASRKDYGQINLTWKEVEEKKSIRDFFNDKSKAYVVIEAQKSLVQNFLAVTFWRDGHSTQPAFNYESENKSPLLNFLFGQFFLLGMLAYFAARLKDHLIRTFRAKQRLEYDRYQAERTQSLFKLKEQVEESRQLAEAGRLAQALVLINKILRAKPDYREAVEFKKMLLLSKDIGSPVVSILKPETWGGKSDTLLYLRIVGTPYTYQAPMGLGILYIGRQKRKDGEPRDKGNDVVIRVPGSDAKSLKISRRHLEIHRIEEAYFVIDKSGGHTTVNGQVLAGETPCRIGTGDKLGIAGVFILETIIRNPIEGKKVQNILQFATGKENDRLSIEATLGDMLTEFPV